MLGHKRLTMFLAAAIVADTIQTLTNAQKLSLPADTAVGTRVKVSDGFVVDCGSATVNGLWIPNGTSGGKNRYFLASNHAASCIFYVSGGGNYWSIDDGVDQKYNAPSNVDEPWQVTTWSNTYNSPNGDLPLPTLTHPAVQQLASPSSAQGGVFVSGGTQDGIYYTGVVDGLINGKKYFIMLGVADTSDGPFVNFPSVHWTGNLSDWGLSSSAPGFLFLVGSGTPVYYSLSNVATPDLASPWKYATDDTNAPITVISVTQGELDAGVTVAGAGSSEVNVAYSNRGAIFDPGHYGYAKVGEGTSNHLLHSVPSWYVTGDADWYWVNAAPTAFPWQATPWILSDSGANPVPTVTRNNVAAEANWSNV